MDVDKLIKIDASSPLLNTNLMPRMPGGQLSRIWGLVDQHGVHGCDVGAGEVLHIVQDLGIEDVLRENVVPCQVLNLVDETLLTDTGPVLQRDVLHHGNAT